MFIWLSVKWLVDAALERKGLKCCKLQMTLLTCKSYKKNTENQYTIDALG